MSTNDSDIIEQLKHGNPKTFEGLFRKYYAQLCHYAFTYLNSKEEAEEIVQDLFCKMWDHRSRLHIHTSLNAYLYKATYLNSMERLRKESTKQKYASVEYEKTNHFDEKKIELTEINHIIQETLRLMPEKAQQVFTMSRYEGLKYREIAEKLSISVKTVEANMGKALKLFRTNLKDYIGAILF